MIRGFSASSRGTLLQRGHAILAKPAPGLLGFPT
jgi:hypothetical protein